MLAYIKKPKNKQKLSGEITCGQAQLPLELLQSKFSTKTEIQTSYSEDFP